MIELKDVWFDYATGDELELEEENLQREQRGKKKRRKSAEDSSADVFGELSAPAAAGEKAQSVPETAAHALDSVLKGVNLRIEDGEFLALVGHNGSGKSTLAKMLNGLLLPVSGTVTVFGKNTSAKKELAEIRKSVGMVFQNPDNQMIASIVEDDIAFGPENIGVPPQEIRERVDWALEAVGMSEYKFAMPFKLSGGQKQRIAIAGMLAIKPRVLVLDESTAMLDPRGRAEVMETVKRLNREEGITVIHITHFMDEAAECGRVVVLDNGVVTLDGTPQRVFAETEKLRHAGLNLPSVMEVARLLRRRGVAVEESLFRQEDLVDAICQLR